MVLDDPARQETQRLVVRVKVSNHTAISRLRSDAEGESVLDSVDPRHVEATLRLKRYARKDGPVDKARKEAGLLHFPVKGEIKVADDTSHGSQQDADSSHAGAYDLLSNDVLLAAQRDAVRRAMKHSWDGYVKYAWGFDTLCPVSRTGKNDMGDLAATIVDSLDTLLLMDMKPEYERARTWVKESFVVANRTLSLSLFETTIRVVGGLLGAYDASYDVLFLEKVRELADILLLAWDAHPSGIPNNQVIVEAGTYHKLTPATVSLAEIALQVEFMALSERSGEPRYAEKVEAVIKKLHGSFPNQGLFPTFFNAEHPQSMNASSHGGLSMAGSADSFYEYLLKAWLLGGKQDETYRYMWEMAMDETLERLVQRGADNLKYTGQITGAGHGFQRTFDHLACFLPGNLALGVMSSAVHGERAERYLQLARELTHTCWQMYNTTVTGLAPESVSWAHTNKMTVNAPFNWLRPEAVESLLMLWRATGDEQYRRWGWAIFQAFERHSRTQAGYSGVQDVRHPAPVHDDQQHSFWLAETLKYLYLLFSPADVLPLDVWVFNTEAHPLRARPYSPHQGGALSSDK